MLWIEYKNSRIVVNMYGWMHKRYAQLWSDGAESLHVRNQHVLPICRIWILNENIRTVCAYLIIHFIRFLTHWHSLRDCRIITMLLELRILSVLLCEICFECNSHASICVLCALDCIGTHYRFGVNTKTASAARVNKRVRDLMKSEWEYDQEKCASLAQERDGAWEGEPTDRGTNNAWHTTHNTYTQNLWIWKKERKSRNVHAMRALDLQPVHMCKSRVEPAVITIGRCLYMLKSARADGLKSVSRRVFDWIGVLKQIGRSYRVQKLCFQCIHIVNECRCERWISIWVCEWFWCVCVCESLAFSMRRKKIIYSCIVFALCWRISGFIRRISHHSHSEHRKKKCGAEVLKRW